MSLYALHGGFQLRVVAGRVLDGFPTRLDGEMTPVALPGTMGARVALSKELQVHRLRREVVAAHDRLGVLALRQNNPVYASSLHGSLLSEVLSRRRDYIRSALARTLRRLLA